MLDGFRCGPRVGYHAGMTEPKLNVAGGGSSQAAGSAAGVALGTMRLDELLSALSAKTPAPGGGAVVPAVGAIACALAGMVVSYSIGKKDLAEHQATLLSAQQKLVRGRELLLKLADEDAAAYAMVNALQKLPMDDARRVREYPAAAEACAGVPRFVLAACVDLLDLCVSLSGISNKHLKSDLDIACVLLEACCRCGVVNVKVNLPLIEDSVVRQRVLDECRALSVRAAGLLSRGVV